MSKTTIEVEVVRAGQPRPYADSVYEYIITFSGGYGGRYRPTKEMVRKFVEWEHHKPISDKERKDWFDPYFEVFEEIEPSKWRAIIIEPYDD